MRGGPDAGVPGAARPDRRVGEPVTGGTQNQDVAYNQCQQVYLAVWGLGGTIRGRFINENGQGVGEAFAISSGQWAQTPKVIYNPNIGNFLVVWHSSASDTRTEVRAQLVTYPAGVPAAGAVLSASMYSSRWITKPAIGYSRNSGRFLVAWARYAADGGAEINARFIDTQAVPVANEFAVTSSADESRPRAHDWPPAKHRPRRGGLGRIRTERQLRSRQAVRRGHRRCVRHPAHPGPERVHVCPRSHAQHGYGQRIRGLDAGRCGDGTAWQRVAAVWQRRERQRPAGLHLGEAPVVDGGRVRRQFGRGTTRFRRRSSW